jgi:hypothetical protein
MIEKTMNFSHFQKTLSAIASNLVPNLKIQREEVQNYKTNLFYNNQIIFSFQLMKTIALFWKAIFTLLAMEKTDSGKCCKSMSMSMLHVLVHAACPSPSGMFMSMLHINFHAACPCPCPSYEYIPKYMVHGYVMLYV